MKKAILLISIFFCGKFSPAQNPGDSVFSTLLHNVYITFPVSTWYDTLTNNYSQSAILDSNIYYPATVVFDADTFYNVGTRFKGNSSYGAPNQKKSFKFDFGEFVAGQELNSMKQINLNNQYNDPTFLREKLYLDFCRANGLDAPRCAYANVYVNGALWSFYSVIEEVDKTFMKTHFGNKQGNVFKGDPSGHLKWLGSNQSSYYNSYELKTNETVNDWSDLVTFIDKINNTSSAVWTDSVAKYFNLNKYLKHYAATMLIGCLDSYTGSGHNYYLYHNTSSNQFEFVEWDVNGSFGRHHPSGQGLTNEALLDAFWVPTPAGSRPLHEKILAQPILKQEYVMNLCGYLNSYFDTTSMYARIDSMANIVRPFVYADPRKQFTNSDFESNLVNDFGMNTPGLKKFVRERNSYLDSALSSYGCSAVGISENKNTSDEISVYPNPANSSFTVSSQEIISSLTIFDMSGKILRESKIHSKMYEEDISQLSPGIYFARIRTSGGFSLVKKLMVE